MCVFKKLVQVRQSPRSQNVRLKRREILDPIGENLAIDPRFAGNRPQEGGLALVAFNQGKLPIRAFRSRQDCNHHHRESTATAEVAPFAGRRRHIMYLTRVFKVPHPDILKAARGYQVYLACPLVQQKLIDL